MIKWNIKEEPRYVYATAITKSGRFKIGVGDHGYVSIRRNDDDPYESITIHKDLLPEIVEVLQNLPDLES